MSTRKALLIAGYNRSILLFRKDLLLDLKKQGYDVLAVAPNDDPTVASQLLDLGIAYKTLPLSRNGFNPFSDILLIVRLAKIIRDYKPTLVVPYTVKPVIFGSLATRFFKRVKIFPLVTGLGYLETETGGASKKVIRSIILFLYRIALKKVSGVIFQNPEDRAYFMNKNLIAMRTPSIVVSGSGVNLNEFERTSPVLSPVRFLLVSRLLRSKGVALFVEAAKRLKRLYPSSEFHVIGQFDERNPDGVDRQWFMDRVRDGDILFHGFQQDVRPLLAQASVFVLPSYYREGIPRTILEALAMGKPVITTDNTGCRETVIDGSNGFLVPVKSVDHLCEAMEKFIRNTGLVQTMGNESYRLATERFDVRKVNLEILNFTGTNHV